MTRCQACQGSCVTSSQERLNTKNWVNTGIIVRATGNVFRCFVSKVTSEISIRYSQIGTGTRTTMHHHSRKIDFLISFHNSDARARLTRFHLSPGSETERGAAGRRSVEAEEQTVHREEPRALRQEQGAGVSLSVLVLLREEGEAGAGPGLQELQHQQAQEQDYPWKSKFYTIIVCDFQQSIKSGVC